MGHAWFFFRANTAWGKAILSPLPLHTFYWVHAMTLSQPRWLWCEDVYDRTHFCGLLWLLWFVGIFGIFKTIIYMEGSERYWERGTYIVFRIFQIKRFTCLSSPNRINAIKDSFLIDLCPFRIDISACFLLLPSFNIFFSFSFIHCWKFV